MQTGTDLNIPDFFQRNDKLIFWLFSCMAVSFFMLGIYFKISVLFALPFLVLFLGLTILNFRTIFLLLLVVLPFSIEMEVGSFGTDLPSEPIVIVLALCSLFFVARNYRMLKTAINHPVVMVLVLMYLWSWLTLIFSSNIFLSLKYMMAKSWYLAGFFLLPLLLLRTEKRIRQFFWCLFVPAFISVIYILINHGMQQFSFDTITNAVHPIYRNHVNYAVFITMLLPFIFLAKTWYLPSDYRHKILLISIPVFLAAIYFSYTRGAWLAVAAMLVYYFVLKWNFTKYFLVVSGIVILLFTAYILKDNNYLKYAPNYEHTIYHDELADHLSSTFEMEDMSTVERFYRWIAAVHLFKEHPIVGVGPNNFVANYKPYTVTAYETYISENEEKSTVHNYFLLLLTEQGLPALILYILLLCFILLSAQKVYNNSSKVYNKYILAISFCLIVFLLNNTLSDLVEANKVGSLFFIALALLVNFSTNNVEVNEAKQDPIG